MGSLLWPIAVPFLACALACPCMALIYPDERPKRILNAFGSLFNATLSAYLGIGPIVRERTAPLHTVLIIILVTLAGTVSTVILAFFEGYREISATKFIPLLLGAAQNYMFLSVRGVPEPIHVDTVAGQANSCFKEDKV